MACHLDGLRNMEVPTDHRSCQFLSTRPVAGHGRSHRLDVGFCGFHFLQVLKVHQEIELQRYSESFDETFRSEEHTSELQSLRHLVCRLLLEKKNWPARFSTDL